MTGKVSRAPRVARRLLARALPHDARHYIAADLDDLYRDRLARCGFIGARLWYWREAISFSLRFARERLRELRHPDGGLVVHARWPDVVPLATRRGFRQRTLETWTRDVAHAVRRLVRAPGFALVTAITLALAIGANTAIFSVVDAVLIDPLAYPDADRLVSIRGSAAGTDQPPQFALAPEFYVQYRDRADALESIGMFQTGQTTVRDGDRVDRLFITVVTTSLLRTLGSAPVLGRLPDADDDATRAQVVVISHWLWTDWFARDSSVLGRRIEVSGAQREIVGVMGPEFRFPTAAISLWVRAQIADESRIVPGRFGFNLIGRMKPGVELDDLGRQLATVTRTIPDRYNGSADYRRIIAQFRPVVLSLEEQLVGGVARPLWILLGTVGIVLLIACANVANLFIVRAESQRRALAVRQALGAGRSALVRPLMAEALILALVGGAGGALLAYAGVPLLVRAAPERIPNLDTVSLDVTALAFTAGLSLLAACLFGLLPALRASARRFVGDLREGGRGQTARAQYARNTLVVVQTASALVLLVGAGLLARSFLALSRVDPGFETRDIFTFQVAPSRPAQLVDGPTWAQLHEQLMDRLRALPGVASVGVVNELPFDEGAGMGRFATERTAAAGELAPRIAFTFTGGEYFRTMGIDLTSGRFLDERDGLGTANALVSRAAADLLWPGESPLGKRLRNTEAPSAIWHTVVGVVDDVRLASFRQSAPDPLIYLPMVGPEPRSWAVGTPAYVVKSPRAATIAAEVRALLREVAPEAPMYRIFTMEELARRSLAPLSFTMTMIGIAAALALVLGAVGIYGVLSYVVARRSREIAVRMALGAEASTVRRMVVLQGGRVALVGVGVGVAIALGVTSVLETLLFGVAPLDAPTFVAMSAAMIAVALLASYLPARRASSVDPLRSLAVE